MKKTAVILFNLGGPDSLKSVRPFLFNLFSDKAIISLPQPFRFFLALLISSLRNKKAQKIYAQIGGKSPLAEITQEQALKLERELSFAGDFKVFVAMRYFHPRAKKVVADVLRYQPDEVILLPLYPQFSSSTSASSLNEFRRIFLAKANKTPLKTICCYPTEPDFIRAHGVLIKNSLTRFHKKEIGEFRFLFSAHGLPKKLIDNGDPYVFHVEETTKKIVENLAEILPAQKSQIDFQVCYQSKVGPLEWTSPSLDFALRKAILDKKIPAIIPVSFVSDHSETLVELDIDYKNLALELGAKDFVRIASLNLDGSFIKALAEICKNAGARSDYEIFSGKTPLRFCQEKMKFCPNQNPCKA